VAERARDAAEREHALSQIREGSRRASTLIEQLLTLARLDPGNRPEMRPVALDTLAIEVCADLGGTALDKGITLTLDAPATVTTRGNPELARILLRNLLDNAIRYTPAGGKVEARVTADAEGSMFVVADNGPGIPEAERANVTRRFHRLAGQDVEGSGLGLSIVARIVELHDARLEFDDNAPGLIARVRFPALAGNHA
jgi:signal transduction histidine kinase